MCTAANVFFDSEFRAWAQTHGVFQTAKMALSDPVSPTTRDASSLVQPRDLLLCLLELLGWAIACVPAHCRDQSCLCSGIFLSPIGQASCRLQSARSLQVDSQAGEDLLTQSTQLLFGRAARNKELLTREVSYRTYSQGSCRITFFFLTRVSDLARCQAHRQLAS